MPRILKRFLFLMFLRAASVLALSPGLLQSFQNSSPFSRPHKRASALSTLIRIFRRALVLVFLMVAHIAPASVPSIVSILKQILQALQPSSEVFSDGIRDGASALQGSIHKAGEATQKVADGACSLVANAIGGTTTTTFEVLQDGGITDNILPNAANDTLKNFEETSGVFRTVLTALGDGEARLNTRTHTGFSPFVKM